MLIDITIKNYLSFKEETTFSLLGNSSKDLPNNYFDYKNEKILKTAIIYGSNASGKTNLLRAINLVRNLIVEGFRMGPNQPILGYLATPLAPFRLSSETRAEPSEFEINFIIKEVPYRYKFSLNNSSIISEELYSRRTQKEKKLYIRSFQNIELFDFDDNQSTSRVLENTLAISIFAKENSSEAKEIHNFFSNIHVFLSQTTPVDTLEMLKKDDLITEDQPKFKPFLIEFLKKSDTGIDDIDCKISKTLLPVEIRNHLIALQQPLPLEMDSVEFKYKHSIYDKFHNKVGFDFFLEENISEGTKKMFEWAGTIFNVINEGKILFIDEIDRSLHPMLQEKIIESFHKTSSKKPFQIIFTTHNVKLMDIQNIFRRDQVWFVDKDSYGESKISSLLEYKDKTRKDLILEKNYYKGRYGGIPNLNSDNLFSN